MTFVIKPTSGRIGLPDPEPSYNPNGIKDPFKARWHHASQLQATVAERMGYQVRMVLGHGWDVLCSEADFDVLVIEAGTVAGRE